MAVSEMTISVVKRNISKVYGMIFYDREQEVSYKGLSMENMCFSMVLDKISACPAINKRKTWEVLRIGDIIENNLVKPWLIRYFLIYLPQNKNMVLL